jgi:N-acyl-D-aspartate/D-glutamate deacylase
MYQAVSEELLELGLSLKSYPNSVFQMISDFEQVEDEFSILTRVSQDTGCASTLTVLQYPHRPQLHRELLRHIDAANAGGLRIMGQVLNRPVGVLMGFECSLNPFPASPAMKRWRSSVRQNASKSCPDQARAAPSSARRTAIPTCSWSTSARTLRACTPGAAKSPTICRKKANRFRLWPTQPASRGLDV